MQPYPAVYYAPPPPMVWAPAPGPWPTIPHYTWWVPPPPPMWGWQPPPVYPAFHDASNYYPVPQPPTSSPPGESVQESETASCADAPEQKHEEHEHETFVAGSLTGDDFSIALQAARSRPSRGEAKRTMSRMPNASKSSDRARGAIEEAILRNYTPTDGDPDSEQGDAFSKTAETNMVRKWAKGRSKLKPNQAQAPSTEFHGVPAKNLIPRTNNVEYSLYRRLLHYKAECALDRKCKELKMRRHLRPERVMVDDGSRLYGRHSSKDTPPLGPSRLREVYTAQDD